MEQRVPVMYQILLPQHEAVPHVAHVPGDLRCPVSVRIMNDAARPDFPCADIHEKQQTLPNQTGRRKTLHLGEVHRRRHILLRFNKLIPPSRFCTNDHIKNCLQKLESFQKDWVLNPQEVADLYNAGQLKRLCWDYPVSRSKGCPPFASCPRVGETAFFCFPPFLP